MQDNFEKTASQYENDWSNYTPNASLLRLPDTSSFVARNFHSISVCVQRCFFDRARISEKITKAELPNIIHKLRVCSGSSFVLNTLNGCRFDYTAVVHRKTAALKHCGIETAALKQRIYERVEAATGIASATQQPAMFTEIHSEVEKAMQYLAKEISGKDNRFTCTVFLVGSSLEKTKIGYCDEFDYNFVLTDLSRSCSVCHSPETPPGFVILKASTSTFDEELFDNNGILNTRIVKFKFETIVKHILSSLSFCTDTGFEFMDPVRDFLVPPGTTSTKLHTHVRLAFTKPAVASPRGGKRGQLPPQPCLGSILRSAQIR